MTASQKKVKKNNSRPFGLRQYGMQRERERERERDIVEKSRNASAHHCLVECIVRCLDGRPHAEHVSFLGIGE